MDTEKIIKEIEKVTGEKYKGQGEALSQDFIELLTKLLNKIKEN